MFYRKIKTKYVLYNYDWCLSAELLPAGRCWAARQSSLAGSRWRRGWRWHGWTCSEGVAASAGRVGRDRCRRRSTPGWRTMSAEPTAAAAVVAGSQSQWSRLFLIHKIPVERGRCRHPSSSFPACLPSTSDPRFERRDRVLLLVRRNARGLFRQRHSRLI